MNIKQSSQWQNANIKYLMASVAVITLNKAVNGKMPILNT
jgi:hypothetical protein